MSKDIFEELRDAVALQQAGKQGTDVFFVGEQLKDICAGSRADAELVLTDLGNAAMCLEKAAEKIREHAKNHKHGNFGFCSPADADRILRRFYGLPEADAPAGETAEKVDLLDFI